MWLIFLLSKKKVFTFFCPTPKSPEWPSVCATRPKTNLNLNVWKKHLDNDPKILEASWSDTVPCTVYNILKFLPTKLNNAVSPILLVTPALWTNTCSRWVSWNWTHIVEDVHPSLHGDALENSENRKQDIVKVGDAEAGSNPVLPAGSAIATGPRRRVEATGEISCLLTYGHNTQAHRVIDHHTRARTNTQTCSSVGRLLMYYLKVPLMLGYRKTWCIIHEFNYYDTQDGNI